MSNSEIPPALAVSVAVAVTQSWMSWNNFVTGWANIWISNKLFLLNLSYVIEDYNLKIRNISCIIFWGEGGMGFAFNLCLCFPLGFFLTLKNQDFLSNAKDDDDDSPKDCENNNDSEEDHHKNNTFFQWKNIYINFTF